MARFLKPLEMILALHNGEREPLDIKKVRLQKAFTNRSHISKCKISKLRNSIMSKRVNTDTYHQKQVLQDQPQRGQE